LSSAGGILSSSTINLASTSYVSGILPIANGGTNSNTALNSNRFMISSGGKIIEQSAITAGHVIYADTNGLPAGSANHFWDSVNNRLGINTNNPQTSLHSVGTVRISGTNSQFQLQDASIYNVFQTATTTTNATVTTLATVPTTTNTTMQLEVRINGRRTGGTSGSAGDSAAYIRTARIKNVGGTVTLSNLQSDYTSEDQTGWNATIVVSGTDVLVRITGAANNNITWQATVIQMIT
jgi:hypothetical protein